MSRIAGLLTFVSFLATSIYAMADSATDSLRISRREAISLAVASNPQVLVAKEQAEQARARITQATALPDPSFNTTLEEETNFFHPGTATTQDFGIGLTVPFPYKLHLAGKVAKAALRSAELNVSQVRNGIAGQAAQAYDALLVALRHEEILSDGKKLAEDFLKKTQARYDAGTVPRLDTIKAKVDLAQAGNELIANERTIATARATLNRLIARPQGAPLEPADKLDVPAPLADLGAVEKLALISRPEILSNASDREGARQSTRLASKYWLPDISLTLSRNYTAGDPPAYSTAGSVNLPLFFWQHNNGEIAEAKHRESELAATANDLAAQVDLDVRTAYSSASTAIRQAVYLRDELLPEAREAFQIASTSYGLGGSSALDLLDAKRTMLDAESQYADALGAANDAIADLEKAVAAPLPPPTGETK